jgi:hypothetical protein
VRHRSIGVWGQKWRCSPRRRGPRWLFGTTSTVRVELRPPELNKRTHRCGGVARGSFLRDEVAARGRIERAGRLSDFFAPKQRRKGRENGSGAGLGEPHREEEEERGEGRGPVGVKRVAQEEEGGLARAPTQARRMRVACHAGTGEGWGLMTRGTEAIVLGRRRFDLVQIQMNSNKVQILSTLTAPKRTFLSSKN